MTQVVTLARHAMATRFELVLHGTNPVALRAAGESAFDEIERLEASLSLYRPSSEIAHVNARAAHEPVQLSVPVFRLLQRAVQLSHESDGAFDITIGPLMRCWGFLAGSGRVPSQDELAAVRAQVGWEHIVLDPVRFTIRLNRPGMMIDLGAIGKGYAIDCAVDLLREAGVECALLHGGTSSIYALGHPPEADAWTIAVQAPTPPNPSAPSDLSEPEGLIRRHSTGEERSPMSPETKLRGTAGPLDLPVFHLRDRALSVSAVWGKRFQTEAQWYGHVLDSRSGQPTNCAQLAAVALDSTTDTDALSTALLTLGAAGIQTVQRTYPAATCLVVHGTVERPELTTTLPR